MCHEEKILLNFALVNGSLFRLPSSSILFCARATSYSPLVSKLDYNKAKHQGVLTLLLMYPGLAISGTSGSTKNPANAIGSDMTPSMMKSLIRLVSRNDINILCSFYHCHPLKPPRPPSVYTAAIKQPENILPIALLVWKMQARFASSSFRYHEPMMYCMPGQKVLSARPKREISGQPMTSWWNYHKRVVPMKNLITYTCSAELHLESPIVRTDQIT